MSKMAIIGSGGHAKVVFDAIRMREPNVPISVFDEYLISSDFWRRCHPEVELAPCVDLSSWGNVPFHVAIGDNMVRRSLSAKLAGKGASAFTVIHPRSLVSPSSSVGRGSFIAAGSIIAASSYLGEGCIINHNTCVDHDCAIGDYCHFAPGSVICGGVRVGSDVLLGAGSVVKPGVKIGDGCVVGAGAVVVSDLCAGSTYAGVPARKI